MIELKVKKRSSDEIGSRASRRLRTQGWIPATVYGGHKEAISVKVPRKDILQLIKSTEHGGERIFTLDIEGESDYAIIKSFQVDPLNDRLIHVDFQRIIASEEISVEVEIELVGTPIGVKNEGGLLDFVTRKIEIRGLPFKVPSVVKVDVSDLHINQHIEAKDIELPEGIYLVSDPSTVIAAVFMEHAVEEEVEVEEEMVEPEVIKKGKKEEEVE